MFAVLYVWLWCGVQRASRMFSPSLSIAEYDRFGGQRLWIADALRWLSHWTRQHVGCGPPGGELAWKPVPALAPRPMVPRHRQRRR